MSAELGGRAADGWARAAASRAGPFPHFPEGAAGPPGPGRVARSWQSHLGLGPPLPQRRHRCALDEGVREAAGVASGVPGWAEMSWVPELR